MDDNCGGRGWGVTMKHKLFHLNAKKLLKICENEMNETKKTEKINTKQKVKLKCAGAQFCFSISCNDIKYLFRIIHEENQILQNEIPKCER